MTDPSTPASIAAVTGLVVFGLPTGVEGHIIVAASVGAFGAQIYAEHMPWLKRFAVFLFSCLAAAYTAPSVAALAAQHLAVAAPVLPSAVLLAFAMHRVIAPGIIRLGRGWIKRTEEQ